MKTKQNESRLPRFRLHFSPAALLGHVHTVHYICHAAAHPVTLIRLLYLASLHKDIPPRQSDITHAIQYCTACRPAFRLSWAKEGSSVFRELPARDFFRIASSAQIIDIIVKLSLHLVCAGRLSTSSQLCFTAVLKIVDFSSGASFSESSRAAFTAAVCFQY
ncbi:hypothetical protein MSAN_00498800 [Mycena sanguinolenta]|uniref:Uncharacterized protein n=1 Tax=Mycena sanguinolenta TaxID=230812 RepID=A0A8H6Z8U7_9AGAR|nr:hypothetical protein MSAN_00498800 [Mycena sanguinolenta]